MKWLPVCCYLGIALWQVVVHYHEIWPSDPAKREALHLCFMANQRFDQLDPAARAACFNNYLPQPTLTAATMQLMPHIGR